MIQTTPHISVKKINLVSLFMAPIWKVTSKTVIQFIILTSMYQHLKHLANPCNGCWVSAEYLTLYISLKGQQVRIIMYYANLLLETELHEKWKLINTCKLTMITSPLSHQLRQPLKMHIFESLYFFSAHEKSMNLVTTMIHEILTDRGSLTEVISETSTSHNSKLQENKVTSGSSSFFKMNKYLYQCYL